MKKILSLLFILLILCSCGSNKPEDEIIDNTKEYIKPLNKVNFYNELNDNTKEKLKEILVNQTFSGTYQDEHTFLKPSGNPFDPQMKVTYEDTKTGKFYQWNGSNYYLYEVGNNLLELIGVKIEDLTTYDYYGNEVRFADYSDKKLIIEIVQNTCEHCKAQVKFTDEILKDSDCAFIQYFAFGTPEEIKEFYKDAGYDIPNNVIVIPKDEAISNYFIGIGVDATPTFLFCDNNEIKLAKCSELTKAIYLKAYDLAYINPLNQNDFVTSDNVSVFNLERDYNAVFDSFSNDNKDKLARIANSEDLTVNVVGQYVEFYSMYEAQEDAIYSIDTYTIYNNSSLVVFYLGNINNNLETDIELINSFIENHDGLNVLTILMDNKDLSTSKAYQEIDIELLGDYVSSSALIPKQFIDTKVTEYPACLFIQDNVFTGGYYGINNLGTLEYAYEIFIGDDSIALANNN